MIDEPPYKYDIYGMKTINRMAAIVTPKEPFLDWSESVLGEEANDCGPELFRSVFLLPERNDINRSLQAVYFKIFEQMLLMSVNAPAYWPTKRDLRTFRKWFDVQLVEIIYDTDEGDLFHDLP